jgi:hypothetical protein
VNWAGSVAVATIAMVVVVDTANGSAALVPTPVALSIEACVDLDSAEVQRLTDLQVNAPPSDATPASAVRVEITCQGAEVTMRARDPVSGQEARRTISLSATAPATRPRLLAISAVELAATVLAEAQARPTALSASPALEIDKPAGTQVHGVPSWRLLAFGGADWFPKLGVLRGGGVRFGFDRRDRLGATIDAHVTLGTFPATQGTVDVTSVSLTPLANVRQTWGRYTLAAGTGPRLSIGHMRGNPSPTSARLPFGTTKPWVGWPLRLGLTAVFLRYLAAELTIEGGYVVRTLKGEYRMTIREVAIEGPWVGATFSVGASVARGN